MPSRPHAAGGGALPAHAADVPPTRSDMRVGLGLDSWSWASPSGTRLDFAVPLQTVTVTDHTGIIFGALESVAGTEANRIAAEHEAIRQDKFSYTYAVKEAVSREHTRFSLSYGFGKPTGFTSQGSGVPPFEADQAQVQTWRLGYEGDAGTLLGGVLAIDFAVQTMNLRAPDSKGTITSGGGLSFEAWTLPAGLRWRWALPVPVIGTFVVEPRASVDWLYLLGNGVQGKFRPDASGYGVDLAYYPHPQIRVSGGYGVYRMMQNWANWMTQDDLAEARMLRADAALVF